VRYYKSKLELKSNSSEILPVNCKFISVRIFFVLKVRLTDLKSEFRQFNAAFTLVGLTTRYRTKNLYKNISVLSKSHDI